METKASGNAQAVETSASGVVSSQSFETLAYIASSGHSGSTLLDMMLNLSPDITGVGEFSRLSIFAKNPHITGCTCGVPFMECPFWLKVQDGLRKYLNEPDLTLDEYETAWLDEPRFRARDLFHMIGSRQAWLVASKVIPSVKRYRNQILNGLNIFDVITQQEKTPIILDSTKDAGRLSALYFEIPDKFRLIYQVRDGRAVALSEMKREGISMKSAASNWLRMNKKIYWASRPVPLEQRLITKYEDLCRAPELEVARIAKFLGAKESLPNNMVLKKNENHNIGGNPMRMRKNESTIKLDEKWKKELSSLDLNVFDREAGAYNRSLGYDG